MNAYDVIHYGQLGYERTSVAYPGLVGGPCLEKDPHILQSSVADLGLELDIANAARLVNERQPAEAVGAVLDAVGKSDGIASLSRASPSRADLRPTIFADPWGCAFSSRSAGIRALAGCWCTTPW